MSDDEVTATFKDLDAAIDRAAEAGRITPAIWQLVSIYVAIAWKTYVTFAKRRENGS